MANDSSVQQLKRLERDLWLRTYLMGILEFDGETKAPPKGAPARAEAMGALAGEYHEALTSASAQELITQLEEAAAAGELDEQTATELRVLAREQREAVAIPTEEAAAWSKLTSEANAVWHKAKLANDWESFAPYIDRILAALKRQAACIDSTRDPYDVWLDQYERGMDSAAYDRFFDQVKATVVPLVHEIGKRPQPEAPFLTARVPESVQLDIARELMDIVGLDPEASVLDCVEHPFTNGMAPGDVRITTHIYENNLLSNVFSVIHEAGHAIYEQNIDPAYAYTCLGTGSTMGIHESQSRFFENIVGRSRAFMGPLLAVLRKHVPEAYGNVSEDQLYRAANIALPSSPTRCISWCAMTSSGCSSQARQPHATSLSSGRSLPVRTWGLTCRMTRTAACRTRTGRAEASGTSRVTRSEAPMERRWYPPWRRTDAPELILNACGAPFGATFYCDYLQKKFSELYGL